MEWFFEACSQTVGHQCAEGKQDIQLQVKTESHIKNKSLCIRHIFEMQDLTTNGLLLKNKNVINAQNSCSLTATWSRWNMILMIFHENTPSFSHLLLPSFKFMNINQLLQTTFLRNHIHLAMARELFKMSTFNLLLRFKCYVVVIGYEGKWRSGF